jgi:acyl dehydratase
MPYRTVYWEDVEEGQELPALTKEVTATTIIAGALAYRDFHPLHHDRDFAVKQGVPNIFLSFLTTNGWAGKYLTEWSGPEGELKKIVFRLESPCFPGDTLKWSGKVNRKYAEGDQHLVEVEYAAAVPRGTHCIGKATMTLPTRG